MVGTPPGGSSPSASSGRITPIAETSEEGSTHRSPAFVGGKDAPFGRAPPPASDDESNAAVPETQVRCAGGRYDAAQTLMLLLNIQSRVAGIAPRLLVHADVRAD